MEVKYTLVTDTGNNDDICDFGNSCDVNDTGGTNALVAAGPVTLSGNKTRYAVALRVRLKETQVPGKPGCDNNNFNAQCEWVFLGSGRVDTEPTNATIFRDPVTRAFRGNSVTAGTIRWLKLKADRSSCNSPPAEEGYVLGTEGSQPLGAINCFAVEMGLKGGIATDVNDPGFLFNDGIGASQMGYLDCTESGPQNIVWELMNGCPSLYGTHSFNYTPLCPPASLFALPNPGSPWNVDWRPIWCVKTRPTSQGSDLVKGLNGRFFFPTDPNPPPQPPNTCPPQVGNGYIQGRNYWKYDGSTPFGYEDGAAHRTFSIRRTRGRSRSFCHPGVVRRIGTEHLSDNRRDWIYITRLRHRQRQRIRQPGRPVRRSTLRPIWIAGRLLRRSRCLGSFHQRDRPERGSHSNPDRMQPRRQLAAVRRRS